MKDVVDAAANKFADSLKPGFGQYIVGPAEPVVNRVRNQYLMELMFKLPKDHTIIPECKKEIMNQAAILHSEKHFKSVSIIPDVDPS